MQLIWAADYFAFRHCSQLFDQQRHAAVKHGFICVLDDHDDLGCASQWSRNPHKNHKNHKRFLLFRYGIPFISYSWIVAIGLLKGIFVVLVGILHGIASVIPFVEATPYLDVHFSCNE